MKLSPQLMLGGAAVGLGVVALHVLLPAEKTAAIISDVIKVLGILFAAVKAFEAVNVGNDNKAELEVQTKTLATIKKDVNHHTEMLQERGDKAIDDLHASRKETADAKAAKPTET